MSDDSRAAAPVSALVWVRCKPATRTTPKLTAREIDALLAQLRGWAQEDERITKRFAFADHWEVTAFVNAVAWISHREDHHPDLTIGYDHCQVTYTTHAVGGLSENDFICAAKIEALFSL